MIKANARERLVAERDERRHHGIICFAGLESAADNRPSLFDVAVKNEAPLKRIHRSIDALNGMRHPIVENHQAIEPGFYRRKEPRACIRLSNVIAKEIAFLKSVGQPAALDPGLLARVEIGAARKACGVVGIEVGALLLSVLYRIDLTTGAATSIGWIPCNEAVRGLSVNPIAPVPARTSTWGELKSRYR